MWRRRRHKLIGQTVRWLDPFPLRVVYSSPGAPETWPLPALKYSIRSAHTGGKRRQSCGLVPLKVRSAPATMIQRFSARFKAVATHHPPSRPDVMTSHDLVRTIYGRRPHSPLRKVTVRLQNACLATFGHTVCRLTGS